MDHISASRILRLRFVADRGAIDDIAQQRDPEALPRGTVAALALTAAIRPGINHVVLASDHRSGRHQGFLVAHDGVTERETFLLLEATLIGGDIDPIVMLRRMVGMALLRGIGVGRAPMVVAVRSPMPAMSRILHDMAHRVAEAVLHPDPGTNVVNLASASLAIRVARAIGEAPQFDATAAAMRRYAMSRSRAASVGPTEETDRPLLSVLDLRTVSEAALIAGARWLYRSRRASARNAALQPREPAARVAGLRRPSK